MSEDRRPRGAKGSEPRVAMETRAPGDRVLRVQVREDATGSMVVRVHPVGVGEHVQRGQVSHAVELVQDIDKYDHKLCELKTKIKSGTI